MKDDHELDAALRASPRPPAADIEAAAGRIMRRLAAAPLPPQQRAFAWLPPVLTDWSLAPAWPRVATLAGAAVLGIAIGFSGFGARIAADLDLARVASADETGVFDMDSVAGLRP